MSIRLPLQTVTQQTYLNETGTSSTASGGIPVTFVLPQDTDNVVVKMTASTSGGGVSALFQTTDDGGTTYYDVSRTSIVSRAINASAQWLNIPISGQGFRSAVQGQTSVAGVTNVGVIMQTIGSALGGSLPQYQTTGLPMLSQQGRVLLILSGNHIAATGSQIVVEVKVNSQSATA